jgi:hypothetical protein
MANYSTQANQQYMLIPPKTKEALRLWEALGVRPGSFTSAVLANNLLDAVCCADPDNLAELKNIVQYVYNEMPGNCWGSPEKCAEWQEARRKDRLLRGTLSLQKVEAR